MKRNTVSTTAAALALGLALAGCSTNDETPTPATQGTTSETTTEDSATTDEATSGDAATTEDAASTGDAAGGTADAAPMSDETCAGFFQNVPVTLAERADKARTALTDGAVTDPASWGEVNLLKQRIEALGEGSGDHAELIERINAPFVEASDAVLDDPDATPADPEITVPDIDVTDSAAAQEEFLEVCSS